MNEILAPAAASTATCRTTGRRWTPARAGALAISLWLAGTGSTAALADDDITVHAARQSGAIVLDVKASAAVPLAVAWSVLTDFDHMPSFLSVVKSSAIIQRQGNMLEVKQLAESHFGLFSFSAASVRSMELLPMHEIRTHLVSGDFDAFDSTTKVSEQNGRTELVYHSEYVPKAWIPPLVGTSVIETETRSQYEQLIAEMTRRSAALAAQAPSAGHAASAASSP